MIIKSMLYMRKLKQENCIINKIVKNKPLLYTILTIVLFNILFNIFVYGIVGAQFKIFTFVTCSLLSVGFLSLILYMFYDIMSGD